MILGPGSTFNLSNVDVNGGQLVVNSSNATLASLSLDSNGAVIINGNMIVKGIYLASYI